MSNFQWIKTIPGEKHFDLFERLPYLLYKKNSVRFKLGNDPVVEYLEGCYILLKNKQPVGRFAFYENPKLQYNNRSAACVGSYECVDNKFVSGFLLTKAREIANEKKYDWLIGPMEGSTWNNYRFSEHNRYANFFMEPYHYAYYNRQFKAGGFKPIARYFSSLDAALSYDANELKKLEQHFIDQGAVFRNINLKELKSELQKMAQLSLDGFANNFLYTPISIDQFVAKYIKLEQFFDPKLVWIVEDSVGEMQAFIFAIKDYFDSTNQTMIVKSVARKRLSPFRGIGQYLGEKSRQIAIEMGYKKIVDALMIKQNVSAQISKKFTKDEYKSYVLYGLKL